MDWKEALTKIEVEDLPDSVVIKFQLKSRINGRNKLNVKASELYGYLVSEGYKVQSIEEKRFGNNDDPEVHRVEFPLVKESTLPPKKTSYKKKTFSPKKMVPKVDLEEG